MCLSCLFIVNILLPRITPGVAAFTMVSVKRRKAPVASALIAGMHKKAPATAAFVVRTTATFAQSSGTDSGTSSSTSISTTTSTSSCKSSSASGGGLLEKFGSPEIPLRLILVGHNPSAAAWRDGHYYSNPSNRMWRLLSGAGIIPANYTALDDDKCPATCGIGFTDLVRTLSCDIMASVASRLLSYPLALLPPSPRFFSIDPNEIFFHNS